MAGPRVRAREAPAMATEVVIGRQWCWLFRTPHFSAHVVYTPPPADMQPTAASIHPTTAGTG